MEQDNGDAAFPPGWFYLAGGILVLASAVLNFYPPVGFLNAPIGSVLNLETVVFFGVSAWLIAFASPSVTWLHLSYLYGLVFVAAVPPLFWRAFVMPPVEVPRWAGDNVSYLDILSLFLGPVSWIFLGYLFGAFLRRQARQTIASSSFAGTSSRPQGSLTTPSDEGAHTGPAGGRITSSSESRNSRGLTTFKKQLILASVPPILTFVLTLIAGK